MKRNALLTAAGLAMTAGPVAAQVPDRSGPPELGPAPMLRLPAVERQALPNGLEVMYLPKRNVPLVQINVVVRTGSVADPGDRLGLASMTAAMLDEGAGDRDALELSEAIDFLGADLRVGSDLHTTTISLHTPVSKLDDALQLLADVVLRPTFPADELDRQRAQRLTSLTQWRDEPRQIAAVLYDRTLFGENHPYGRSAFGTRQSLTDMRVDDLRRFHRAHFVPNNATVIVVGDIDRDDAMRRVGAAFSGWQRGNVTEPRVRAARQVSRREVYLVDKPGAAQSVIRIGRIGVARDTDDYYALVVMNTILGGSFASRLNQTLREEKQYTYGARSGFSFRQAPGPFTASADVQTAVTDSALYEFIRELRGIVENVTDQELDRARNFVALRFPARLQAVSQIAASLETIYEFGLPLDYYNGYIQRVLSVTKDDVMRVAREYIDPERMAIIVVGDRSVIEGRVRALNLGPVRILTVDDVLGPAPTDGGGGG